MRHGRAAFALLIAAFLLVGMLIPQVYSAIGEWRLLSPTEFTTIPYAAIHGIYTLNGGTGSIGAGNAWAVGDSGFIFHWDGFSWREFGPAPSGCQLNSVNFGGPLIPSGSNFAGVSSSSGWIVGGTAGGASVDCTSATALYYDGTGWSPQTNGLTAANLTAVYSITGSSSVEAFAVSNDAGHEFWHWFGAPSGSGAWHEIDSGVATGPVNSVYMNHGFTSGSADEGWAVGNGGKVYHYYGHWQPPQLVDLSSCGSEPDLMSVAMASTTDGWAVGSCGSIYHYTGGTWKGPVSPLTTKNKLLSIVLLNNNEGWAVGVADSSGPTIVHGTNLQGTPSWTRIQVEKLPTAGSFLSVTFGVSGNNIWAAGAGGLMALCSSGCSDSSIWGTTTSPLFDSHLNSVFMTGDNDGWAVGNASSAGLGTPQIFHWDGSAFTRGLTAASNKDLFGVYMTGSSEGWAIGGTGGTESTLHFTGGTWNSVTPPGCGCTLRGIYMVNNNNGWAVGTGGKIEHLTSSGGPWTITSNSGAPTSDLYGVFFDPANSNSGWAVGANTTGPYAIIVHTANGGLDGWPTTQHNPGGTASDVVLRSIYMKDNNHMWVVGTQSTILFSGNNGATWTLQLIAGVVNGPLTLTSVFLDSNDDGWAVGTDSLGYPVAVRYNGGGWTQMPFVTPVQSKGTLRSVFLTSSTNGLAVGDDAGSGTLALAFHLDPPGLYGGTTTVLTPTTIATTSTLVTTVGSTTSSATSSETSSSTEASTSQVSTSTPQTSTSATSQGASTISSSSATSMGTVTVTASSSTSQTTPLVVPAVPGFPLESIVAGIIIGLSVLVVLRQRRRSTTT
jgi:photosystem II stability/assembly factor-like uncharacterized protein